MRGKIARCFGSATKSDARLQGTQLASRGKPTASRYRKMGRDRACPSKRLAAGLLGFGFVVVWTRCAIESTAFQQRLDVGIAPGEIFEQAERIGRSTTREQRFSKAIAVFAFQSAVLLNPLDAVGVEDFAPEIRIISGRISAGESMRKIKAAVARRHRWKINAGLVQRFLFKHDSIRRNPRWIELMPGLVELRSRQVFGRFESLFNLLRVLDFIEQRLRHRLADLVIVIVIL